MATKAEREARAWARFCELVAPSERPAVLTAMRGWVADCAWADSFDVAEETTDAELVRGVQLHFMGGIAGFLQSEVTS